MLFRAVHLVVDYIITLLPKVTHRSAEISNILLDFSREAVSIHPERFLTVHGTNLLRDAFLNPHIVSKVA